MAHYAVIGLGTFGRTVAVELARAGHDVVGIDIDEDAVARVANDITQAATADCTDENVLDELGIAQCDAVLVAIGEDLEASILTTLLVSELKGPKVWVKAKDQNHHRILSRLSAHKIVHPEYEVGLRIAKQLMHQSLEDIFEFGRDHFVMETKAPRQLWDRPATSTDGVTVLAHRRGDSLLKGANETIRRGDHVLLLGPMSALNAFDLDA